MRVWSRIPALTPGTVAVIYVIFGLVWILASDQVVLFLFSADSIITTVQSVKGALFVGLSGALIWYLMSRREAQLLESHERLEVATQRLGVLQRVFRHNIRNEMNVVKGYIELARDRTDSPSVDRELAVASRTAGDVIGIGEKLGLLDQYGFSPVADETIDLVDVATNAVDRFSETYPAATVTLDTPETSCVVGDGSIAHVIDELLENAAEHYDGSLETLRVEVAVADSEERAAVQITDNGPGIPEGELRALRAGHESHLIHLSSVGFWLVYWLCDRLDGEIDIETEPGSGTSIGVAFPKPGNESHPGGTETVPAAEGP